MAKVQNSYGLEHELHEELKETAFRIRLSRSVLLEHLLRTFLPLIQSGKLVPHKGKFMTTKEGPDVSDEG